MNRRLRGPGGGDVRDIDRDIVIGRADADVEIDDPEVSRRHAVVRPVPEGVEVEDLGSSNGTFVDGQRIRDKLTTARPATLRVGRTELRIEVEEPAVTKVRGAPIAEPDVTVQRPIAQAGVTAAGQQAAAPPPGGPPPGESPPSTQPKAPAGTRRSRRPSRAVVFGIGGLLIGAALAAGLYAAFSSSSSNKTAASVAPRCDAKFPPIVHDDFPEPTMQFSHDGLLETSLHMAPARISYSGKSFDTGFEYNHQLPGPMLVFCPGDKVVLHLFNGLPLATNLHVHGLHVSPQGDGDNVFVDVKPLTERTYRYQIPLDQFPGFYWYHPHLHPLVEPEEAGGLAGAIVVEGSLDDRLPDVPQRFIIIQGGNRRTHSKIPPPPGVGGKHPPVGVPNLLVNGAQNPTLRIRPGQIQRWRILNATSDRLLDLAMPGVTFQVLAQDGITLRDMLPERELLISPGSRVEVLVRGGKKGLYTLSALPFHQCHKGCNPFAGPVTGVTTPKEDLLTMVSTGAKADDHFPTGPIGNPPDLRGRHIDVRRTILFSQGPATRGVPPFQVDHKIFNPARVDITMKLNSVEEWTLKNPTSGPAAEWHTFHIHQNSFQIVSRDGKPLNYVDWQDNVTLGPGETVVVLMNPIDFTGKFVFHCHVIFHEDHGMMAVVQVVKNPKPGQVIADRTVYLHPPATAAEYATAGDSRYTGLLLYCHLLAQRVA
jgi:FtsP/CotA-like multicopper oxidase with cupredoxin domain